MRLLLVWTTCVTSALAAQPISYEYTVVHSFGAAGDPGLPTTITQSGGKLYGTTLSNTVFSYAPAVGESVKCTAPDTVGDLEGVTSLGDKLFGVAYVGGPHRYGAVFVCKPDGTYRELHGFGAAGDGLYPSSPLLAMKGLLVGVTLQGGIGLGSLYSITPHGQERTLHSFQGIGTLPYDKLTMLNGIIYGAGDSDVWAYSADGSVREVCQFNSQTGFNATGGLLSHDGILYGATMNGGANGSGTIYAFTPGTGCTALASLPQALFSNRGSLARKGDSFYGVSYAAGGRDKGVIFRYRMGGHFQIVHAFTGTPDGDAPSSGLVRLGNTIYGTTYGGGTNGQGTIFAFTPPPD